MRDSAVTSLWCGWPMQCSTHDPRQDRSLGRWITFDLATDWIPCVWVLYLAVSAGWAAAADGDVQAALSRWLFYYAMPLGVYLALRTGAIGSRGEQTALMICAVVGVYLALIAICEVSGATGWIWPRYIASRDYAEFFGRARGPLLNPVGNGVLLLAAWAALWALWPAASQRRRLLLVLAGALIGFGQVATLTRSVWLAAGAATLWLAAGITRPELRRRLVLTGLAAAVLAAVLLSGKVLELKRDRDLNASAAAESVRLRPILASLALRMVEDRPLLGFGLGQYDRAKLPYLSERTGPYPLERARPYTQHNVFLSLLVETGVVGLAGFLLMLGLWFREAHRRVYDSSQHRPGRGTALLLGATIIGYAVNGLFHDVSIIPQVNLLLFATAGLCRGSAVIETARREIRPARFLPWQREVAGRPAGPAS